MTNTVDSILASKLEESLTGVLDFLKKAPRRLSALSKKISECDLEVTDLTHYIEEAEYEEVVFAELALQLKEVLQKRRQYKDERRVLESTYKKFKSIIGEADLISEAKEAVKETIQDKKSKPYSPRIREELFVDVE